MLRREDRRDLGWLGLWVAVYALAFAPVFHAVSGHGRASPPSSSSEPPPLALLAPHDERVPHSHGPSDAPPPKQGQAPAGHTHGVGSVEHLQAVALPAIALPPLAVFWIETGLRHLGQERVRPGKQPRPTAMPQAP